MFGTLVVQLPSEYDGGMLRVRHRKEELTFDFSGLKGVTDYNYAAFYADCEHELCEVTRGYRLCLVYNLVYSGNGICPAPIDNSKIVAEVVEDMRKWEQDDDGLPFMAYVLNHDYCEASLSFGLLKNGDRAKAEVIQEAEKQMKFYLYLGIVTLEQNCSMDGYGYECSREDLSIEEIIDEELSLGGELVSPSGETLDTSHIDLTKDAIVPEDVFETIEPAEEDFEPYTGNEGATLDRTYHQAALFIWPRKNHMLVAGNFKESLTHLNSKLCESQDSQQQQQLGECESLAKEIVTAVCNSDACPDDEDIVTLLSCLKRLKATALVCSLFKAYPHLQSLRHQPFCEAVVELGNAFGWEQLEEALVGLFERVVAIQMNHACIFLSSLATGSLSPERMNVCQKMVKIICIAIDNEQKAPCNNPRSVRSKDFVCKVFKTLCVLQCEDQLRSVIPSFFKQRKRYSLQNTLIPAAIELHETMKENNSALVASLVSQCVGALERHTQHAPTWSVQFNLQCGRCNFCINLAAFLRDPQKKETRFPTKQSNRSHLEQQLRSCSDVKCTTERHASPYTLVVTKTEGRFKIHRARLALLDRVRPLLGQEIPPVKRQKLDDDACIVID